MEIEMIIIPSKCGICKKDLNTLLAVIIKCDHKFHTCCFLKIKTQKCPICNEEFSTEYNNYCLIFTESKITRITKRLNMSLLVKDKQRARAIARSTSRSFVIGDMLCILEELKKKCSKLMDMHSIIEFEGKIFSALLILKEESSKFGRIKPVYDSHMNRYNKATNIFFSK